MKAVIGALRAVLGMDTVAFEKGVGTAVKQINGLSREFKRVGDDLKGMGQSMSLAITAPLTAFGALALHSAANFQDAMTKVQTTTGATGATLDALSAKARNLGAASEFGAKGVADAIVTLSKHGLTTSQILGGALDATVKLADATGTELAPAGAVVADVMARFHKSATDLPAALDQITGTIKNSKLTFEDYGAAIQTSGSIAARLGLSFEDFNAALALTSQQFSNGEAAGAAFRQFLVKLAPTSKQNADAMHKLGLDFFDAQGKMLPLAGVAEKLQKAFGGLSDQARAEVLTKLFGRNAMLDAVALMDAGAAGVERVKAAIANTSAEDAAAARAGNFSTQLKILGSAFQELQITVGNAGLLTWATDLVKSFDALVLRLSTASPELLRFGLIAGAIAAALGPIAVGVGMVVNALGGIASAAVAIAPSFAPILAAIGPWGLLGIAIVAAAGALYVFRDDIKMTADGSVTLGDTLREVAALFKEIADTKFGKLVVEINNAANALNPLAYQMRGIAAVMAQIQLYRSTVAIGGGIGSAIGNSLSYAPPVPAALPPVTSADFGGAKPAPAPTGGGSQLPPGLFGTGGGSGGGGKSPAQKIQEYTDALAHSVQVAQMDANQRAISEALYKAEQIAREGGIRLTDEETQAIIANATALQQAKIAQDEKTRLDALAKKVIEEATPAQEKYNKTIADLNTLLQQGSITQAQFDSARKQAAETASKAGDENESGWSRMSQAIADASKDAARELLQLDGDVGDILGRLLKRIAEFALQILVLDPLFKQIKDMLTDAFSPLSGGGGGGTVFGGGGIFGAASMFGDFFPGASTAGMYSLGPFSYGGGFASGGNVSPGNWYKVNESGVEAFAPGTSGRILSNRELGSLANTGPTVSQTLNFSLGVQSTVRAEIMSLLPQIADAGAKRAQYRRQRGGTYKTAFNR